MGRGLITVSRRISILLRREEVKEVESLSCEMCETISDRVSDVSTSLSKAYYFLGKLTHKYEIQ